jgi:hypothetical protein
MHLLVYIQYLMRGEWIQKPSSKIISIDDDAIDYNKKQNHMNMK